MSSPAGKSSQAPAQLRDANVPVFSRSNGFMMKIYVKEKTEAFLQKIGEAHCQDGAVIGRAIIETVMEEGIADEILAGIDWEDFRLRGKRHRGMYHFAGQRLSSPAISDITGIPAYVIRRRLELGWPLEKAAWTPVGKSRFKRKREVAEGVSA